MLQNLEVVMIESLLCGAPFINHAQGFSFRFAISLNEWMNSKNVPIIQLFKQTVLNHFCLHSFLFKIILEQKLDFFHRKTLWEYGKAD